jgi:hypothetical protein
MDEKNIIDSRLKSGVFVVVDDLLAAGRQVHFP